MGPQGPRSAIDWSRLLGRRDFLRLTAVLAGGVAATAVIGSCATRRDDSSPVPSVVGSLGVGGPLAIISGGGDPTTQPGPGLVFEGFRGLHPGIEWDVRSLPGGGPEWDRLARALVASGEPVDLIMIDGQQVRAWSRDGLLANLSDDPSVRDVLARVPAKFQVGGPGESATRAFPLAVTRGVHTSGLYYNKALLDRAGIESPTTLADLEAMVEPLAALGAAPLVHCSGDVFFNQILLTWMLPMVVERAGMDPLEYADRTVRGEIGYDSPEWVAAFQAIADLRASRVLLDGSGATDYAAMQQVFLQGRAAATYQGTWMLSQIQAGTSTGPFELHIAPPPLIEGATVSRPILSWGGFGIPATAEAGPRREAVYEFLEYASRPEIDRAAVEASQSYSPIVGSNAEIVDAVAREFLPLFEAAISPLDWLWEPEIVAEIDNQVQALVKGETDPSASAKAVQVVAKDLRARGRAYYT